VLHLEDVSPEDLHDLIARVYGSPEALATAIGGPDYDAEDHLLLLCQRSCQPPPHGSVDAPHSLSHPLRLEQFRS